MSYARKAAQGGLWFAGFRLISQAFSWAVTIMVARILVPEDYGLMAMATILTGYVEIFSEMGLGAAIIQRKEITREELSSIFWLLLIVGIAVSVCCFALAYPTAWIFDEPRIIPITQLTSGIFVISSLMIVPLNIMSRELRFKRIGLIQLIAVIVASSTMLVLAHAGFGVWAIVYGIIAQRLTNVAMCFAASKWRPMWHMSLAEAKSFLQYGAHVAGSRTLFYIFQRGDKFLVGKLFNAQLLGYYSFAMQLASIPTDKIVSIVQQVSFPVFARHQDDMAVCRRLYLQTTKYVAFIVVPLFCGGFFLGEPLILAVLGEKWMPAAFLFRMFCISQLVTSFAVINSVLHNARGKPGWTMRFNLMNSILIPTALFFAAPFGFNAVVVPWITLYLVGCAWWTFVTLRTLDITISQYLEVVKTPIISTVIALVGIWFGHFAMARSVLATGDGSIVLGLEIIIGCLLYAVYMIAFEKKIVRDLLELRRA